MNFRKVKVTIFLLGIVAILSRCGQNAPHDNPLDPNNPDARFTVSGQVYNYYPPFTGLGNVQLVLRPLNRSTFSDPSGRFWFTDLKRGEFQIIAQSAGYQPDTLSFVLKQDTALIFHLDALPQVDSVAITSHRVGRFFPPEDLLFVEFTAVGKDPDGANDITDFRFSIPELAIEDTLTPLQILNTTQVRGSVRKMANELNASSIESIVGKAVFFTIVDKPGSQTISEPHYLFRVIPQIPSVVSPSGLITIPSDSTQIGFQWEPISFAFPFTFTVELFRVDLGIGTLVNRVTHIPSGITEIYLPNPGTPGDYFWVVYVVDEFGNSSRSREGAFRIF